MIFRSLFHDLLTFYVVTNPYDRIWLTSHLCETHNVSLNGILCHHSLSLNVLATKVVILPNMSNILFLW